MSTRDTHQAHTHQPSTHTHTHTHKHTHAHTRTHTHIPAKEYNSVTRNVHEVVQVHCNTRDRTTWCERLFAAAIHAGSTSLTPMTSPSKCTCLCLLPVEPTTTSTTFPEAAEDAPACEMENSSPTAHAPTTAGPRANSASESTCPLTETTTCPCITFPSVPLQVASPLMNPAPGSRTWHSSARGAAFASFWRTSPPRHTVVLTLAFRMCWMHFKPRHSASAQWPCATVATKPPRAVDNTTRFGSVPSSTNSSSISVAMAQ